MKNKEKYFQLLQIAKNFSKNSYSPYSEFKVGAAVLCEDDKVFCGTNIENASYGLSVCAERVAVWTAIANGAKQIKAVAVYSAKGNITPCGACRQVMYEFQGDEEEIEVITENMGQLEINKLSYFLPCGFKI